MRIVFAGFLALVLILPRGAVFATESEVESKSAVVDTSDDSGDKKSTSDKKETTTKKNLIDTSALEQKREDTLDKIKDIKNSISSVKNQLAELEKSKSDLQSYINKLDAQAASLADEMKKVEEQIARKQADIEEQELELEAAQERQDRQYEDMKIRIQYMYENGSVSYLETILTSKSISELLGRMEYIAEISQYDRNMLDEFIATKELVAAYKEQLEQEEEDLQALSDGLEEQKEAVDLLISTKTKEIAAYQSQINEANMDAADYQKQLLEQEKALEQVEAAIAAAAAANARAEDGDGGASGFIWPLPASHRITSGFGNREVPIAGASANHRGIDIGAASGSAILAAYSGTVTTATYNKSAGNYIVISHGGGLSTVYMHCSALYVSVGQQVNKGDTIGAVGSTGYSTGPHLHFGVIKNGTYVNPLGYVN